MGFLSRMGVLNNWLSEESLWIQLRIHLRAYVIIVTGGNTLPVIPLVGNIGSLPKMIIFQSLREFLARKEYDDSGNDMFYQLFASDDAYYPTLSWQPLAYYSACPETLKDMSDL